MLRSLLLIAAISLFSVSIFAQAGPRPSPTPRPEEQDQPIRVFTEEVRLPVAATDTYGHYDPTLTVADVLVLEDGKQQQIRSIQHLPTNVLVLLD
ncbi:MAG TPA: hypothetical protein VNG71_10645, partial [Pyrinomonadaceae bacterium]|nr:hypothetical protein [Pyrinomonadaceae bacterium]